MKSETVSVTYMLCNFVYVLWYEKKLLNNFKLSALSYVSETKFFLAGINKHQPGFFAEESLIVC